MVCDRCGAERRATGPCPNCGAPPPGSPAPRQYGARGSSGDGYGGSGGARSGRRSSGVGFGANQGNQGGGRGYASQRPRGRNGRHDDYQGYSDYEEIDRGRALVPVQPDLAPVEVGTALPALPGLPQTEEEERALGIRRPAYIPANDGHRKRRISSFRVISGVLSLMLICMAACTGGVLLGKTQLEAVVGTNALKSHETAPSISFTQVPQTPAATPGPANKFVTSATTARNVDNNFAPVDITSKFTVNNYVYVVVTVRGVPKNSKHTLSVGWFLNGQDVTLPPNALTRKDITVDSNAYFALEYPTAGLGMVKVYWDRPANDTNTSDTDSALAQKLYFAVQAPVPTATPSPKTTTTPNGTPASGNVSLPAAIRPPNGA
ncbi:MAG TPA: hypothetical protein VF120_01805 [Ktedonobacterales bacterium]